MADPSPSTQFAQAEILVPSVGLRDDMPFFTKRLGFRLDQIFPADDPAVALLSGHGVRLRLDATLSQDVAMPVLRLLLDDPDTLADGATELTAPNGMRIELAERNPPLVTPTTQHSYIVRRLADQAPWVIGRAGMHYRDLIPDRLGGSIIASPFGSLMAVPCRIWCIITPSVFSLFSASRAGSTLSMKIRVSHSGFMQVIA